MPFQPSNRIKLKWRASLLRHPAVDRYCLVARMAFTFVSSIGKIHKKTKNYLLVNPQTAGTVS